MLIDTVKLCAMNLYPGRTARWNVSPTLNPTGLCIDAQRLPVSTA
jgi:hypothetical protein